MLKAEEIVAIAIVIMLGLIIILAIVTSPNYPKLF
jgi:hypothetical protein